MGIYTEKRDQLIEKIKVLEKRIAGDTAKKKALEDKLKEVSRLAMAEEYNCKPVSLTRSSLRSIHCCRNFVQAGCPMTNF
jgi:hypothetical protein